MIVVLKKALRDSRWTIIELTIGLAIYTLFAMSFYPTLLDQQEEIDALVESFPKELLGVVLGDVDLEQVSIADPDIYLHGRVTTWVVLIMGAVVMLQAFNAITNSERDGTMDMTMSLPFSRREMLIGRMINTLITILIVLTGVFIVLAACTGFIRGFDVPVGELALAVYSASFILTAQASLTYMLAAFAPSSRKWVGPTVYVFFFASYLMNGFAANSAFIDRISPLFLFHYYDAGEILRNGIDITNWIVLLTVTGVFVLVSMWAIDHKELGT